MSLLLCNGADRLLQVTYFSEQLDRDQLYSLLKYKSVPKKDCLKIWSEFLLWCSIQLII